jgi:predicted enzyme related to lactoylglutathione lyase
MRALAVPISLVVAATAVPVCAQEAATPAQRTTMIGRHDNQLILAKVAVSDLVRSYRFYTEVVGFKVPNAEAALARATAAGYEAVGRPPGPGPMAFAMVRDPDGYTVEFVQAPNYPD